MAWNLVVTAFRHEARHAKSQLKELAGVELRPTQFRDVLVGQAGDSRKLFEALGAVGGKAVPGAPVFVPAFSRLVPLEESSFPFKPDSLMEELMPRIEKYASSIPQGASYAVRVERRGFKGVLSSHDMEKTLAEAIWRALEKAGKKPKVDLGDPDCTVVVEIVGSECGVGLITKELRRSFKFVRPD